MIVCVFDGPKDVFNTKKVSLKKKNTHLVFKKTKLIALLKVQKTKKYQNVKNKAFVKKRFLKLHFSNIISNMLLIGCVHPQHCFQKIYIIYYRSHNLQVFAILYFLSEFFAIASPNCS
jgi:hypothetical protein